MSSFFFLLVQYSGKRQAARWVCDLVANEYVRAAEPRAQAWIEDCRLHFSDSVRLFSSKEKLIEQINERFSVFRISHLAAFEPEETVGIWSSVRTDTGARARLIDGEIVVVRLVPGSPALGAGVRVGDVIVAIDGTPVGLPEEIEATAGVWELLRADDTRVRVSVKAVELVDPADPSISDDGIFRLPSFLPKGFGNDKMTLLAERMSSFDRLILDLRKNRGGSFPAMLRAASLFLCERQVLGTIRGQSQLNVNSSDTDQETSGSRFDLEDDLGADLQLERLSRDGVIVLRAYKGRLCFRGPLAVLIDEGTASAAEVFAHSMKDRPNTHVLGWSTAGQVVMARWFSIEPFGPDYTVSIPVALYQSAKGVQLEHRGVSPDEILSDRLREWRSGKDPWIAVARERLRQGLVSK